MPNLSPLGQSKSGTPFGERRGCSSLDWGSPKAAPLSASEGVAPLWTGAVQKRHPLRRAKGLLLFGLGQSKSGTPFGERRGCSFLDWGSPKAAPPSASEGVAPFGLGQFGERRGAVQKRHLLRQSKSGERHPRPVQKGAPLFRAVQKRHPLRSPGSLVLNVETILHGYLFTKHFSNSIAMIATLLGLCL